MSAHVIQLISACAGSAGFALIFNVRGGRIISATVSGFISWGLYLLFTIRFGLSDFYAYILASAGLALFAEIMARAQKAPATAFLVIGMIPLLPGGSLYLTLYHAVSSNWTAFGSSGIYTLMLAIAIALGIICMMSALKVFFVIEAHVRRHLAQ
ncbi:MAG: threonine/serine exporter family protein [Eubacteriales bacterium]|nr:threonine/serine exporter family protein [Eubacteriales bacterium]